MHTVQETGMITLWRRLLGRLGVGDRKDRRPPRSDERPHDGWIR